MYRNIGGGGTVFNMHCSIALSFLFLLFTFGDGVRVGEFGEKARGWGC